MQTGLAIAPVRSQKVIPFQEWREIRTGRNKGKVEIRIGGKRYIVARSAIRRFPAENDTGR